MEYNNSGVHTGDGEALSTIATLAEHERWMRLALDEGKRAACAGEIPIGAVVVNAEGEIIGAGHNTREHDHDPTGHAEIHAIRQASQHLKTWRLEECTLVVTVEPCLMCAGAILMARIPTVVMGAWEEKTGAVGSQYDVLRDRRLGLDVQVYAGVLREECAGLMRTFFEARRPQQGV